MAVIAVMPAAGLMISIGKAGPDGRSRYEYDLHGGKHYGEHWLGHHQ